MAGSDGVAGQVQALVEREREDRMREDERQIGKDAGTKRRVAMCAH